MLQDGLRSHEESLAIWQRLTAEHPEEADYQSGLASIQNCRGNMLRATGKLAEARKAYETALAIQQKLADAHPIVTQYQSELAQSYNNFGILLSATGARPRPARRMRRPWRSSKSWPRPTPPSPSTRGAWRPATTTSAAC